MAAEFSAEVSGFSEIRATLNSLCGQKKDEIERKALRAVVAVVKPELRNRTPLRTYHAGGSALAEGELKQAIRSKVAVGHDGQDSTATVDFGKLNYVADWVDSSHAIVHGGYSKLQADGSRRGPGTVGDRTEENPFVRQTQDATEDAAASAYIGTMTAEVEKVVNSGR